MKRFYVGALTILFAALSTALLAAPPGDITDPNGPLVLHQLEFLPDDFGPPFLGLSKEQKAALREIRSRFHADTRDLRYGLAQKGLEMRKLFTDPRTDEATILTKEKEISTLILKFMDRQAQMKVEWRRTLTPEQIQRLDTMPRPGGGHEFVFGMGEDRDN